MGAQLLGNWYWFLSCIANTTRNLGLFFFNDYHLLVSSSLLFACYLLLQKYWCIVRYRASIECSIADLTEIPSDYTLFLLNGVWYSCLQLITIWKSKLWNSELSRNPISDWQLLDKLVQHEHKWELKLGLIYLTKPKEEVNNSNQHLDNYMLLSCGKQTELLFSFSASEDFKSVSYQSMVIKELSLFYWCS